MNLIVSSQLLRYRVQGSGFRAKVPHSMLYASLHSELRKIVPRFENSCHPDQDECEANPGGFHIAIAEETEQRISHKNDPSERGEENQCEKVVGVTLSHEAHIEHRTGNQ